MHYQVRIWNAGVNRLNPIDRENVPGGRARELVGTVTCATGNGQGVDTGISNKLFGLIGISEHLIVRQLPCGADAIFLARLAGL